MSDERAATLLSVALILWLGAIAMIVVWKLFTRSISLAGLLQGDRSNGETFFSPGRVQLLIATVLFVANMMSQVIADPTTLPVIRPELLLALGGSQAVYLGGKARSMLR